MLSEQFQGEEVPADEYSRMRYPKALPFIRFMVDRYWIEGFGHLMIMRTTALFGMMVLVTGSFTPSSGLPVPYLLIDMMQMKKKRTVFVEYYDCTANGAAAPELEQLKEKYACIPDYNEKPAWYIEERMPCSLIKGSADGNEDSLCCMVHESVRAYAALCKAAPVSEKNLEGLRNFQRRMITEGNPSSATMEKMLGREGAKAFFLNVVMPVN